MTAEPQAKTQTDSTGIGRWQTPSLIFGIAGLVLSAIGFFVNRQDFFRAYLPSYIFWFSIVSGSLGVLCLQYMTGGEWGLLIRRPLGASARTMWLMFLFFIPIFFGLKELYPWADRAWAQSDPVVSQKLWYLNAPRFIGFAIFYFFCWILWAWAIRRLSLKFYEDRAPETDLKRRRWAGAGLPMIVLTLTFCSIDWLMSIEPRWSSTMYGITFLVGCGLSAFAFVTFFLAQLAHTEAMEGILKSTHLRDLGNLMLTFVMLYAYTAFSEFLLIWYANTHEEIPHYMYRELGAWGVMGFLMCVFHFFLPFFLLLMRPIKDKPKTIAIVAVIVIVFRYVAIYWLVAPSWYGEQFHYSWMDLTTLFGIGGVWLSAFISQLKGQTIIPIHETWVEEAIREGALRVHG